MSRRYSVKYFKVGNAKSNDKIISYMRQRDDISHVDSFHKIERARAKLKGLYFSNREKYWRGKKRMEKAISSVIDSKEFGFDRRKEGVGIETYTLDKEEREKIKSTFTDEGIRAMTPEEFLAFKQDVIEVLKEYNAITNQHDFLEIHYPQWINRVKERLGVDKTMSAKQFTNFLRKYII